jgi:hypothetical protein
MSPDADFRARHRKSSVVDRGNWCRPIYEGFARRFYLARSGISR